MTGSLAAHQKIFAAALLDREAPVPEGLASWTGQRPRRRFGVYRNNVSSALGEALAIRHPVVERLVGEAFFRAMAREFALRNPPSSPVLIDYGEGFPDFIASFGPAASLAYLADVARLESAHWRAYHAADADPAPARAFAEIPPDRLAGARFELLTSTHLVSSPFPIVAIWRANTHDAEVRPLDLSLPEDALVARPEFDVEIRRLPPGACAFLSALKAGATLGDAALAACAAHPGFDLAANLAGLMEARIVAEVIQ
jgi:hypothetical protein